jgi:hypothetical protein
MTIKEIAELCGVSGETVRRWIHSIADPTQNVEGNLLQNAQGLAEKLEQAEKSGKAPANFTLEETLAIIRDGGGNKTLASLLEDNARQTPERGKQAFPDYRLITALNESVRIGAITPAQFRAILGIPPAGTAKPPETSRARLPPPCHDLPDAFQARKEMPAMLSGTEALMPPIPVVQAFIDECCIREGSMTHLDIDTGGMFFKWLVGHNARYVIDNRRLFKYLGLMGYETKKKNGVFSVKGLSLRPEYAGQKAASGLPRH